jgi:hypothetical protein
VTNDQIDQLRDEAGLGRRAPCSIRGMCCIGRPPSSWSTDRSTPGRRLRRPSHAFWPEPISLLEAGLIDWQRILGPRQITDADLLAQAVRLGGRFVTFDHRVGVEVVAAAEVKHLCVIPAT